jgi:hypothetical protein
MSNQKNLGTLIDVLIACSVIAIVFLTVWNMIAIRSLTRQTELNKSHLCGMTSMIFGPVDPERYIELCDLLRADLYTEWQQYK